MKKTIIGGMLFLLSMPVLAEKSLRIIGGSVSLENAWPAAVQLQKAGVNESGETVKEFACGSTLIASRWVLTAAHCVTDEVYGDLDGSVGDYSVLVDSKGVLGAGEEIAAANIYVHPDYDVATTDSDLALIELAYEVTGVPFMPLYNGTPPEVEAVAVGWGVTSNDSAAGPSDVLREVTLVVTSNEACNAVMQDITPNMLCAGGPVSGGKDTCSGDSGGPLVMQQDGEYRQIGVTSWGGETCAAPTEFGVYTRLSNFSGWIETYISGGEPQQPAEGMSGGGALSPYLFLFPLLLAVKRLQRRKAC